MQRLQEAFHSFVHPAEPPRVAHGREAASVQNLQDTWISQKPLANAHGRTSVWMQRLHQEFHLVFRSEKAFATPYKRKAVMKVSWRKELESF